MSHFIFYLAITLVLVVGWLTRHESYLSPEDGLGYYFGIIGGSMMLSLALYSFRKKFRFMRNWGKIKHWFSAHMFLGVLGPVFILYHANFSMGSTNSALALWSMIIVAGSGLIGRYFYKKIHFGLYGRQASLNELKEMVKLNKGRIGKKLKLRNKSVARLSYFEKFSLHDAGVFLNVLRLPIVTLFSQLIYLTIGREISLILKKYKIRKSIDNKTYKMAKIQAKQQLRIYVSSVSQLSGFTAYVKLFSIWHYLHLPLFVMMILTGVVHVFVVHAY